MDKSVANLFAVCMVVFASVIFFLAKSNMRPREAVEQVKLQGLICNKNTYHFGLMTSQEASEQEHTFVLVNSSKHPITILKQSSTCGCTVAELTEGITVPVDGKLEVPVKAGWAGRAGAQSAIINLLTDDPETPIISLTLTGVVKVPVIVTPANINFGLLKPGEEATRIVKLYPGTDPKPFRLTGIQVPSKNISISRVPDQPSEEPVGLLEKSTGNFAVKITAPKTGGREQTRIVFQTDISDKPELRLDITAEFQDILTATPKSVLFFDSENTDILTKELEICHFDKDIHFEPKIQLIWESNEKNPFSFEEIKSFSKPDDSMVMLNIKLDKKKAKQILNQAILHVEDSDYSLDIPIMAVGQVQ